MGEAFTPHLAVADRLHTFPDLGPLFTAVVTLAERHDPPAIVVMRNEDGVWFRALDGTGALLLSPPGGLTGALQGCLTRAGVWLVHAEGR